MARKNDSLEVVAQGIEREVRARYTSNYRTAPRDSGVHAAEDMAIVRRVAEAARGKGWFGVLVVRDYAITAAVSSAADCLSVRAIERGRGRRLMIRALVNMVADALDNAVMVVHPQHR